MKIKLPHDVSRKRCALLAQWITTAMAATTDQHHPDCFVGMDAHASKEVKEVLDDLFTICDEASNKGDANGNAEQRNT